ncbi:MAG: acetyl-CoA carboxylase biotin carboxyl carrier protein [Akkermansiaceae bacterium]|nr:acetyl-CoA carboxylase biotin carboxyl carrier protein [Akkermansiaceae bacterium]
MDLNEIKQIVELMDEHGLTHFKLEQDDSKLELSKGSSLDVEAVQRLMAMAPPAYAAPHSHPHPAAVAPAHAAGHAAAAPGAEPEDGTIEITSPMVGTFYRAPGPDKADFVEVGAKVGASTVVCIIEAMKVMNEIQAEVSGTVTEVLVENGTPVQFGEPLFRVRP